MFGVNEIMAAVALEQVGDAVYSLLNAVVDTVLIGGGFAFLVVAISSWQKGGGLLPVAVSGGFLASVILAVFFEHWGASNVLHLSRLLLWSPWTFIVLGVVGAVFIPFLVANEDSPHVEITHLFGFEYLYLLIWFVICLALIILGILGLFDFGFVRLAHTIYVTAVKIQEKATVVVGVIVFSTAFIASLWYTLTADRGDVAGGCIFTLFFGAVLVFVLLVVLPHYFSLILF